MQVPIPKLITILGPTASGKTGWGLMIAKHINGEIISADSRQIYKHMNIGTAKETGAWQWQYHGRWIPERAYMIAGIPHYLIDCVDPKQRFSVATFQKRANKHITHIHRHGKIPLLVGGTGLYLQSVVDRYHLSPVRPNKRLRQQYAGMSTEKLYIELSQSAPEVAISIDPHNRVRLIRALEVAQAARGGVTAPTSIGAPQFDILQIGIHVDREVLYARINTRIDQMMEMGLLQEVQQLREMGYGWELPSMSAVGYRQFRPYFEGTATLDSCIDLLKRDTRHYAKRQLTWFRRDKRIVWCETVEEAMELVVKSLDH